MLPDPRTLGRNVARLREARGWSQSELARRSDVSQAFISSLEGGRRGKASTDTAHALARALGVTVDDLLWEDLAQEAPGRAEAGAGDSQDPERG